MRYCDHDPSKCCKQFKPEKNDVTGKFRNNDQLIAIWDLLKVAPIDRKKIDRYSVSG